MYEEVWSFEVYVFYLNQDRKERSENIRDGNSNQAQDRSSIIGDNASRRVGIGNILEKERTRYWKRNNHRSKKECYITHSVLDGPPNHAECGVIIFQCHWRIVGWLRRNEWVSTSSHHRGECS